MSNLAALRDAKEQLALLRKEQQIILANGLKFYSPAGWKHDRFHRSGHKKFRYVRTGNRFGKSELGVTEDVAWLRGEREWLSRNDPDRYKGIPQRCVRGLLIVENWDKANEIFTSMEQGTARGKLFKYIPADAFHDVDNRAGNVVAVYVKSIHGGISMLKITTVVAFKQDPLNIESSQWDFIHVDEPIPKPMWNGASRGLMDTAGKAWFTCTPLTELWINDFFLPKRKVMTEKSEPWEDGDKLVITGCSYDNEKLDRKGLDDYFAMSTLSAEERETRLNGRPSGASGLVYPQFDFNLHVYSDVPQGWAAMDDPPAHYTCRAYIDPHTANPTAVLYSAVRPDGVVFFFTETFEKLDWPGLAERMFEVMAGRFWVFTLADPWIFNESNFDDTTGADDLAASGIVAEKAPKDLKRGIKAVQKKLAERTVDGKPTVMFSADLIETLYEFDHYVWNPKKLDSPVDKDDHMMENLYRAVISDLEYIDLAEPVPKFLPQPDSKFDLSIPVQSEVVEKITDETYLKDWREICEEDGND